MKLSEAGRIWVLIHGVQHEIIGGMALPAKFAALLLTAIWRVTSRCYPLQKSEQRSMPNWEKWAIGGDRFPEIVAVRIRHPPNRNHC